MTNKTIYHYVYRITHIKHGMHYYGARTSRIDPSLDLGFKYFSSSEDKLFKQNQKDFPKDYRYKVIGIFSTRALAITREIRLHKKFDVGVNKKFYNKSKQTSTSFDRSGIPWKRESAILRESRMKVKRALPGYKHSNAGVPCTPESNERRSKALRETFSADGYVHHLKGMPIPFHIKEKQLASRKKTLSEPGYINPKKGTKIPQESIDKGIAANAALRAEPGYLDPRVGSKRTPESIAKGKAALAATNARKKLLRDAG